MFSWNRLRRLLLCCVLHLYNIAIKDQGIPHTFFCKIPNEYCHSFRRSAIFYCCSIAAACSPSDFSVCAISFHKVKSCILCSLCILDSLLNRYMNWNICGSSLQKWLLIWNKSKLQTIHLWVFLRGFKNSTIHTTFPLTPKSYHLPK